MKFAGKIVAVAAIVAFAVSASGVVRAENPTSNGNIKPIFDDVLSLGTYTELDFQTASASVDRLFDGWKGGCTAMVAKTEDGKTVVGRNMDFLVSDAPAYVFRVNVPEMHNILGLTYLGTWRGPTTEQALANGLTDEEYKTFPFAATDVMNDSGLYVEMNMREGENWADGSSKFNFAHTNPEASLQVSIMHLPALVGLNCANIGEALEYVKTVDWRSLKGNNVDWNLAFFMADADGRYGLLEFARGEISWLESQPGQANFYITERFQKDSDVMAGVGRYEYLLEKSKGVKTKDELFDVIRGMGFSLGSDFEKCPYDTISDIIVGQDVGDIKKMTLKQAYDPANKEAVTKRLKEVQAAARGVTTREEKIKLGFWNSTFGILADPREKTLKVRFFEDDARTAVFSVH